MFDVGFWELALIGLVMLIVVGPERLPKIARTAGLWLGRGRRMLSAVKSEIDREIKAEELKEILNKQARSNPLETILDDPADKPAAGASEPGPEAARTGSTEKPDSRNG
jgi:sec-independent protein translocase protein TatB